MRSKVASMAFTTAWTISLSFASVRMSPSLRLDFVLMDDLDVEDVLVERLRLMQVLHEQAHRADLLQ